MKIHFSVLRISVMRIPVLWVRCHMRVSLVKLSFRLRICKQLPANTNPLRVTTLTEYAVLPLRCLSCRPRLWRFPAFGSVTHRVSSLCPSTCQLNATVLPKYNLQPCGQRNVGCHLTFIIPSPSPTLHSVAIRSRRRTRHLRTGYLQPTSRCLHTSGNFRFLKRPQRLHCF